MRTLPHQLIIHSLSTATFFYSRISIPLSAQMIIFLVIFLVVVTYHGRLVEVTSRLDFLWKQQAERELSDMIESRHNNMQLLKNILPDHVAKHFLSQETPAEVSLFLRVFLIIVVWIGVEHLVISRSSSRSRAIKLGSCSPACRTLPSSTQRT